MTPLRLLLIEDSQDDATLTVRLLSRAGYAVTSERVQTPEALVAALSRQRWDLAIADYTMPRFRGTAALTLLRKYDVEMPFIFVSGTIGEDVAVTAMKGGAQDYIMKGNLKRLVPAVERELREAASRRIRTQAEARLAHLAYHDALTDLPNRVLLNDRLQQALLAAHRAREPLALMVLDLDEFKAINDSLGHRAGDDLLQQIALRLRALVREVDTVARLGGDEFAFLLPRTDGEGAVLTARKVLQELRRPLVLNGRPLVMSGSVGVAWFPEHGPTADALLQKADIAMYAAKSGRLGCGVYAPDRDGPVHQRLTLVTALREGIERNQFSCDYQPIVDLRSGAVIGVEALARWQHPQQGCLLPREFIEVAEQTGLIEPLTFLILDQALTEWTGLEPRLPVAVNLSPRNLRDPDLPDRIADLLQLRSVAASDLVLEVTENFIMSDPSGSTKCLSRLHEMGVRLALDDFGTGYSSLMYLRQLPLDELKIDRSFVSDLAAGDYVIVQSTIDLGHRLGLTVVAEGVESAVVYDRLFDLGCDAVQGFFIAKPRPAIDAHRWVVKQRAQRRL